MIRSLNSAITGMKQFQEKMDVIGNNVANVNTTAFKSSRTDFAETFSHTLQQSQGGGAMQVGSGVTTTAIKTVQTQGAVTRTGVQTDLAITGEGYFIVKDTASGNEFATRAGDFQLDSSGYLVTNSGHRLQGFSDAALTTRGDLQIDTTGKPATAAADAVIDSYSIDTQGKITVKLSDGTSFVRGQILLQKFQQPQALVREGANLYSGISDAGPLGGATPASVAPGTNGLGSIESGSLELSNVDLATEFADLITTQRAFQASARMISTSDELIQEVVNLKR